MWKKHRYTILSFVLMVGIFLTGLRLQQFADAAGPATDNKTGSPAVKEHKITFVQGGKELDLDTNPALKIDLTSELTVTIKDKFNFNKNDDTGHIDDNSYVEYELGQYFDITNVNKEEYTKPDSAHTPAELHNKTICKTTLKREADGKIKVRFDFSFADPEMFNQSEIEVNAIVKLKVNQDDIKTPAANGKVKILGKAYGVESSGEEFTVNKEGKLNLNNGTVDWTVDVLRKKKGLNEQLSLAGYVFNDNLKDVVGEYEVNTFKINGNQKDLDNGNRTNLTYTIKNDDCTAANIGTAKIEFSTLITKDDLFRGRTYKNKAKVFKENSVIESNEAKVELKKFGYKQGKVKIENDKQYIEWCIVINEDNKELEDVIIEDPLMVSQLGNVSQTRKESFYQVWDNTAGKWEDTKHDITPESDNKYKLNNITKKLRLTIITNPFDTDGGYYEFKNDAKIFWGSSSVHRVILDDSKAIGRGKLRKEAVTYGLSTGETETKGDRRKNEAGDIKRAGFETEWRSKVTISDTDNQKYYLYDAFVFGKGIKANNAELGDTSKYIVTNLDGTTTNIRNGVDLSKVVYKDIYHQRLVNPENPLSYNPKNLTSKVYLIKKKDDNTTIGHLLEISGFDKGENEVGFKSKIVETWMVISQDSADSPSEVRNFMFLEKEDGTVIEERTAKAKYNTKILSKQALSKEAATEFVKNLTVSSSNNIVNDDVFDSTAKKAKASDEIKESAFNIKDRSIIYRLSVNAGKINDTDGDFGVFTVTDKLPDGWELVPIKDDKEYLIYKGSPATSVAKIDATVLAEGSPIDLPAGKLNFLKTNNKLEFKFTNLDSPYVILFKLQLKEDKFKEYINTKNNTVNNEAEITAESTSYNKVLNRWLNHTVKSSQEAIINEEFLTKTYDANAQEQEKKDYLKWDIIYTPYKNYPDNTKVRLEDKFGDKLSIRKEQDGSTLAFQGNNYRIFTGKINAEGIFEEQYEITTGLSDIFKYDKNTKQLIIDLPDSNETYKISYITDILGDINAGIGLGNEVYLREGMAAATTVKVEKTYEAKVASSGKVKGFEKLTIIKKNVNGDKLLSGAKFTLTKNSTEVGGSPKTTDAEGKISFEKLLAGEYVLKEVQAPDGYQLNTTEYKIKITDLENGKKVELIDDAGNPVVKHGNATQSGNEITITNELKPENKTNLGKLKIVKKSEDGSKALFGAKFELYKGTNLITGEAKITDNNGIIEYDGLGVGDYILKETEAPVGYKKTTNEYGIKVTLAGTNVTVALDKDYADANMSAGELTVSNVPEAQSSLTSLKIIKKSNNGNKLLSGAEFELKKNNVAVTATPQITGANGELTFEGLTEGIYVLKEVKAPNGYKKNDTEYVIKIEKVGNNFIKTLNKDYADAILTDASGDLTVINVSLPSSGNGGGGGVGGGGTPPVTNTEDPTKPTKPEEPTKSTKPIKPTKPDNPEDPDVPKVPDMPEEPETPDTTPTTPSYPINRTPDPNDPNSPDEITVIGDDGAPLGKYVKKQKPNGEFEYVSVDDGTPLGGHKVPTLPKTGGAGNAWYYAVGAGLVLGAGIMLKKRDEEEQES